MTITDVIEYSDDVKDLVDLLLKYNYNFIIILSGG